MKTIKESSFRSYSGSCAFVQGITAPTSHESISIDRFKFGTLTFFIDVILSDLYILLEVDEENKDQTWSTFPSDVVSFKNVGVLPHFDQLYWMISEEDDPFDHEPLPTNLYEPKYAVYWWNKGGKKVYYLKYDFENNKQIWTLVAQ